MSTSFLKYDIDGIPFTKLKFATQLVLHIKNWLGCVMKYIELYLNFDETYLKNKSDHTSNNELKLFFENIVVLEEEWFYNLNLTYDATFPTALIKRAKSVFNQK